MQLPFTGPLVSPGPALQFALWVALGRDPHDPARPRVAADARGWDCNDHAFAAVQDLRAQARAVFFVDCKTETGEQHMIAAYLTDDRTPYARDNRAPADLPLEELVQRGYVLEGSSPNGEVWTAP
jgi:hypothetical protein